MTDAETPETLPYVIVGGGIGGLATALALVAAGRRVTLLERAARPAPSGAGLALYPNGLAVLYGLGLRDEVGRTAYRTRSGTFQIGARGYTLPVPDYGHGLDHALALPRARLHRVLHEAIAARGVDVRFGHEVVGAAPDGRLEVRTARGVYELDAGLVIGADGLGSVVRDGGGFGARRATTPGLALRALVPGDPFGAEVERWAEEGVAIGAPMGDGTSYLVLSASTGPLRRALSDGDLPTLRALAERMLPGAGTALTAVRDFAELLITPITTVTCERWHDGRLVLLGDAAHAMAPHLGQGANSALLDAYVLAEELGREQAGSAAIGRYASRRQPGVTRVQRMARAYMIAAESLTAPGVRHARNALAAAAFPLARLRSPVSAMLQEHPARTYEAVVRNLAPRAPGQR